MFFKTKRSPRKTTRQTLSTEQLEPKAMFSVSPVEPVVALDVGPVNQVTTAQMRERFSRGLYEDHIKGEVKL